MSLVHSCPPIISSCMTLAAPKPAAGFGIAINTSTSRAARATSRIANWAITSPSSVPAAVSAVSPDSAISPARAIFTTRHCVVARRTLLSNARIVTAWIWAVFQTIIGSHIPLYMKVATLISMDTSVVAIKKQARLTDVSEIATVALDAPSTSVKKPTHAIVGHIQNFFGRRLVIFP